MLVSVVSLVLRGPIRFRPLWGCASLTTTKNSHTLGGPTITLPLRRHTGLSLGVQCHPGVRLAEHVKVIKRFVVGQQEVQALANRCSASLGELQCCFHASP